MKDVDCNSLWIATKIILVLGAGVISIQPCFAQSAITPDNTLGTEASLVTPVTNPNGIPTELIEGGAQRDQNLFHSFREFNVNEGRGAYFLVPNDTIQNVLTRVTGNNPSSILGILGTTSNRNFAPTDANLFLINPNGIVFGKNASLDVNGSFVGTTANAIKFGEGFFSATNPQAPSGLLTIAPTAFLFNQINAQASIQNNSVTDVGLNPLDSYITPSDYFTSKGLRVADGKSLLLVGGDINIDGGGLVALGGRVELGGLAGAGTIGLNEDGNNLSLSFPASVERSDVVLSNDAGVRVTASDGGSIAVNARNLQMTQESDLFAGIENGLGSDNSKAGNIDINATGAIDLNVSYIQNLVQPGARGQGGDVNLSTSTLRLEDGAQVSAVTYSSAKGGSINVDAQDIQLIGVTADGELVSGLGATAESNSTEDIGEAGNINIQTNTLLVRDGAQVVTLAINAGKGGNINVDAQDIQLIGRSFDGIGPSAFGSTAQKSSTRGSSPTEGASSTGDAGNTNIQTNTLLVRDGAQVTTATFGAGKGGSLIVNASKVQLIGTSANGQSGGGLFTAAGPTSTGDAGDLKITTSQLQVLDGAIVSAATLGAGKGGNLTVNTDSLQLEDNGTISALSQGTGIAGNINLNVKNNFNADRGQVLTQAEQSSGGNINITAGKNIFLRNNSDIKATLLTTEGSGGDITLNANVIVALEGSDIFAFAPEGKGGNIKFNTFAVLSDPLFRPTSQRYDRASLDALDNDNRVDINASGKSPPGTIIGIPDISFFQNGLIQLPENPIDTAALVASSCVVRSNKRNGTFYITGKAGLPDQPGDAVASFYSAVDVQSVPDDTSATKPTHRWTLGDPIVEPTGVYRLENGQRILSRECGQ